MRLLLILISLGINLGTAFSAVDFSGFFAIPQDSYPSCLGNQYFAVGFTTNFEINNDYYEIQRSTDPNFSWAVTGTAQFDGHINGCGSCGGQVYSVNDYGPFVDGEVWYYRVKTVSNSLNINYHEFSSPVYINASSIVDVNNQVTHTVEIGSTPDNEASYIWNQENVRTMQGVSVSLMNTEVAELYLEQNNNRIYFNVHSTDPIINIEVNVNGQGYSSLYNGSAVTSYIWENSSIAFPEIGDDNLKVRITDLSGNVFYREFNVHVVPKSDELFIDNYCNMMRVWKCNDPDGGIPIVFSEGIDAYNTRTQQFYVHAGKDLMKCLLDKGFDIYILDYNLNSQSIINNSAIYQSAVRYVSSINNKDVVAMGMSMGGVICRFACAKAENDGVPLPISKFVSLDAPHQYAVASTTFQDLQFEELDPVADAFDLHNINNSAAKELLSYNAWDPSGNTHNNFFTLLNSLNGDGYPHLVESIGVSFSNSQPNPASGVWLNVDFTGELGTQDDLTFELSDAEKVPGSYLPPIKIDASPISSAGFWKSLQLSALRPFLDPTLTITQTKNPTFIPYSSALDIVDGQSKFDQVIVPSVTGYHDVLPSDIIEPLVNALLKDIVYVQNIDYAETKTIIARDFIYAGNNVNILEPSGDVNVLSGADITFKAGLNIFIEPGFHVLPGGLYHALIDDFTCNGEEEFQHKSSTIDNQISATNADVRFAEDNVILEVESNLSESSFVKIYPNPVSEMLNINFSEDFLFHQNISIQLIDLMGRVVLERFSILDEGVSNNSIVINLSTLTTGVYTIHLNTDNELISIKHLIKQ